MTALIALVPPPLAGPADAEILYQGPVVQVAGSFAASVALGPQTCSSLTFSKTGKGLFDIFEVGYPTTAASPMEWYLTVLMPNPKSAYYSNTPTTITLRKGRSAWSRDFHEQASKVPASQVHFSADAKSGTLDLTLSPTSGARSGPVHVAGFWKPGTCAAKLAKGLPL